MCKDELDKLAEMNPKNLKVVHTLTRHNDSKHGEWKGLKGRVSLEMLNQIGFPKPSDETFIFKCGPKGMHDTLNSIF